MKGRKPKPTHLKVLEGNRGHRKLEPHREPAPRNPRPRCPHYLRGEARKRFQLLARELYRTGILTIVDTDILAVYCEAYGRWREASAELKTQTYIIQTTNGNWIQNPLVGLVNKAEQQMLKAAEQLGMSPSARSRIRIPDQAVPSLEDLLK